ncbi:hypothetical protein [Synechococcus sp. O70.1]|uniref:hypothetical protein n=1 Tax=Synechococcus sp. O70.1 TaxID=2964535 RepID=UPI0039C155F6
MTLLLGLLIGLAIGFCLGVYTCRLTQRANSQLLDEILRKLQADLEGFKLHISESLSESYQNFLQHLAGYRSQLVKNISNQQNILSRLLESTEKISQNLSSSSSLQKTKETNEGTAGARLKSLPPGTISQFAARDD